MATLSLASPNQISSTSGRIPRLSLAASLRESTGELLTNRQFEQDAAALDLQAEQQAAAQKSATIGNVISGVGTVGQAAMTAKQLGWLGGKGATATATGAEAAAAPSLAAASASSAATVPTGAGLATPGLGAIDAAGEGVAIGTGASTGTAATAAGAEAGTAAGAGAVGAEGTGAAATGAGLSLGSAAAGAGGAAIGTAAGQAHQKFAPSWLEKAETFPLGFVLPEGATRQLAGAKFGGVVGAATGFVTGGPWGAVIGGIGGALGGSGICICTTVCYGKESPETDVARAFRDKHMTKDQLKGYYALSEDLVPHMLQDKKMGDHMRHEVFDPMIRVGRYVMKMPHNAPTPSLQDVRITRQFLETCRRVGEGLPVFVRSNGERII